MKLLLSQHLEKSNLQMLQANKKEEAFYIVL